MTNRGSCVDMKEEYHTNYTFVFQRDICYHCVKLLVRTVNVLEKLESKSQIQNQTQICLIYYFTFCYSKYLSIITSYIFSELCESSIWHGAICRKCMQRSTCGPTINHFIFRKLCACEL